MIGNDTKLAAIALDQYNFIVPVPGGIVKVVQDYQIYSFFPLGFLIKSVPLDSSATRFVCRQAYLNGSSFCRVNEGYLRYRKELPMYDINIFWELNIHCKDSDADIYQDGHINSFNKIFQTGNLKFEYSSINFGQYDDTQMINNNISFMNFTNNVSFFDFTINATVSVYGLQQNLYFVGDSKSTLISND